MYVMIIVKIVNYTHVIVYFFMLVLHKFLDQYINMVSLKNFQHYQALTITFQFTIERFFHKAVICVIQLHLKFRKTFVFSKIISVENFVNLRRKKNCILSKSNNMLQLFF